jgi:hypothetical protein
VCRMSFKLAVKGLFRQGACCWRQARSMLLQARSRPTAQRERERERERESARERERESKRESERDSLSTCVLYVLKLAVPRARPWLQASTPRGGLFTRPGFSYTPHRGLVAVASKHATRPGLVTKPLCPQYSATRQKRPPSTRQR